MITPGGLVYCPGHFTLGRRTYGCWKKEGHGSMSLHDALVQSCDVYFYQAGLKLGVDRLAFFARGFNLGRRTGIELPSEQPGLIPTAAWKERRFSEPWGAGETVSASIGQGFDLATPLQLAVAYAAIANGGRVVRPRLVLRTQDPNGRIEEAPAPETVSTVPVSAANLAIVRDALTGVVEEPRGTGGRARVPGMQRRRQDRHGAGRASAAHEGSRGGRGADQVPRPRLVRRVRAGRCAADRGRGAQRARRPRRQRRGADRAARARALGGEAPAGRAGGRAEDRRRRMWGIDRRLVQNFDWTLFCLVFSLVAIGIVNLISSTHSSAGLSDEVRRQLISLGIGCVALVATVAIDYRHFERFAVPIFVTSLLLLAATLVLAPVTRGSQSWLFGGRLQPSELVKIALVLMLARFFQRNPPGEIRRVRDLIRPLGIAGLPVALIVLQRDTGVALLTVLVASTYLAFVRIPWRGWAGVAPARCRRLRGAVVLLPRALSAEPDPRRGRSRARSPRVGLSGDPVADRGRLGRPAGQGLGGGHAVAAAVPSDAAHGLRVLGARRGVGLPRQQRRALASTR